VVILTFVSLNLGATKERLDDMQAGFEKRARVHSHLNAFDRAISDLGYTVEVTETPGFVD